MPFVVEHPDPHSRARRAAVGSPREQDPLTRQHARRLMMTERLRQGFALSRTASRLRGGRR